MRYEKIGRIIRFFSSSLMLIGIIGSVLVVPSFLPMVLERREFVATLATLKVASRASDTGGELERVRALTARLTDLRQSLVAPARSAALLDLLIPAIPGMDVSNLTITPSGIVSISGRAASRRDLLSYEQGLRSSGWFQELASPLSNIVQETNVQFSLRGTLAPEVKP